jgi:hypothetical protein
MNPDDRVVALSSGTYKERILTGTIVCLFKLGNDKEVMIIA